MASSTTNTTRLSLLGLPFSIRQRIYMYLLAPHPHGHVTTINYTLSWPWLDKPSNTTFAGPTQVDLCQCPHRKRKQKRKTRGSDHVYVRHRCLPPEVQFKSGKDELWVLQSPHQQFNFLRPATEAEHALRPKTSILLVSKQIHNEALPVLYRGRNFLFLTGPCPRGRYQAFASQTFFECLSPLARAHVTALSLLCQPYEEDCTDADVAPAFASLAVYINRELPGFKTLSLHVCNPSLTKAINEFDVLQERGVSVLRSTTWGTIEFETQVCPSRKVTGLQENHTGAAARQKTSRSRRVAHEKDSHRARRTAVWEEVKNVDPEAVTTSARDLSKKKGKERLRVECEDRHEWVDAMVSPTSSSEQTKSRTEEEGWEVI